MSQPKSGPLNKEPFIAVEGTWGHTIVGPSFKAAAKRLLLVSLFICCFKKKKEAIAIFLHSVNTYCVMTICKLYSVLCECKTGKNSALFLKDLQCNPGDRTSKVEHRP